MVLSDIFKKRAQSPTLFIMTSFLHYAPEFSWLSHLFVFECLCQKILSSLIRMKLVALLKLVAYGIRMENLECHSRNLDIHLFSLAVVIDIVVIKASNVRTSQTMTNFKIFKDVCYKLVFSLLGKSCTWRSISNTGYFPVCLQYHDTKNNPSISLYFR